MRANIVILEGSWWKAHERPLILPYFLALAGSHTDIEVSHRTFRSAEDIKYWVKKIPKNSRSFLYIGCHGENLELLPVGSRSKVSRAALLEALGHAKEQAIAFLHFGCCEMVDPDHRRKSLQVLAEACGAYAVSGYSKDVDFFQSTLLDLAVAAQLYEPFASAGGRRGPKLKKQVDTFFTEYDKMVRMLELSILSRYGGNGVFRLLPQRLR